MAFKRKADWDRAQQHPATTTRYGTEVRWRLHEPTIVHQAAPNCGFGGEIPSVPYPLSLMPKTNWIQLRHRESHQRDGATLPFVCGLCQKERGRPTPYQRKLFLVAERLSWTPGHGQHREKERNFAALQEANLQLGITEPIMYDESHKTGGQHSKENPWHPYATENEMEAVMGLVARASRLTHRSFFMWLKMMAATGESPRSSSAPLKQLSSATLNGSHSSSGVADLVQSNSHNAKNATLLDAEALPTPPLSSNPEDKENISPGYHSFSSEAGQIPKENGAVDLVGTSVTSLSDFYSMLDKIERTSYVGSRYLESYADYLSNDVCNDCWTRKNAMSEEEYQALGSRVSSLLASGDGGAAEDTSLSQTGNAHPVHSNSSAQKRAQTSQKPVAFKVPRVLLPAKPKDDIPRGLASLGAAVTVKPLSPRPPKSEPVTTVDLLQRFVPDLPPSIFARLLQAVECNESTDTGLADSINAMKTGTATQSQKLALEVTVARMVRHCYHQEQQNMPQATKAPPTCVAAPLLLPHPRPYKSYPEHVERLERTHPNVPASTTAPVLNQVGGLAAADFRLETHLATMPTPVPFDAQKSRSLNATRAALPPRKTRKKASTESGTLAPQSAAAIANLLRTLHRLQPVESLKGPRPYFIDGVAAEMHSVMLRDPFLREVIKVVAGGFPNPAQREYFEQARDEAAAVVKARLDRGCVQATQPPFAVSASSAVAVGLGPTSGGEMTVAKGLDGSGKNSGRSRMDPILLD